MFRSKLRAALSGLYPLNKFLILVLAAVIQKVSGQERDTASRLSDTLINIGEVRVSAYRISGNILTTPGSIAVVTAENLRTADGLSLTSSLNSLPGISVYQGTLATGRIVIRGMGSRTPYNTNRIRVYLNDIPLTTADGVSAPEEIDIQSAGKMEIIKGPSSALYGSGLGGSINIFTPLTTGNEFNAEARYGSFNTAKLNISGTLATKKSASWLSLGHIGSEGYRQNNHYRKTSVLATNRWEHNTWTLNSTLVMLGVNSGIPSSVGKSLFENSPWKAAPNWLSVGGYEKYFRGIAAMALRNNSGPVNTETMLFGKYSNSYERRPFNNLDDHSASWGVRARLEYKNGRTEIAGGLSWSSENYGWKLDQGNITINENSENRKHLDVFSIANLRPVDKLTLSAAAALNHIRYSLTDHFPANGDQSGRRNFPLIFSPRIGLNYSPYKNIAIYASAGHGFSLPSPEETLLPEGDVNPDLKPEQGFQYEAGIRFLNPEKESGLDLTFYMIRLRDLLVTKRISEDVFTGINAGKTHHQGLEVSFKSELFDCVSFPGKLSISSGYTLTLNRFTEFTDNNIVYDGNELPGIPRQTLHLEFNWGLIQALDLITVFNYSGKQYLTDDNTYFHEGYLLGDIKLVLRRKSFIMNAGINNLAGTLYPSMIVVNAIGFGNTEPRYYYPGLPRNFYAGLRFTIK